MPLQSSEKAALDAAQSAVASASATLATIVGSLVADTEPNPLQVQLDEAIAQRDAALTQVNTLQGKIDEARTQILAAQEADLAEDAADANGDALRAAALQALA